MLAPLYIGEIGAPESRGALLALEQLSIVSRFPYKILKCYMVGRFLVLLSDSGLVF